MVELPQEGFDAAAQLAAEQAQNQPRPPHSQGIGDTAGELLDGIGDIASDLADGALEGVGDAVSAVGSALADGAGEAIGGILGAIFD